ncbi:hypothetical protein Tco_1398204 [Tanacetum coccineum]
MVEDQQDFLTRGEKREDSPPNLNGSGGDRFRKKRKANMAGGFEGLNNLKLFSPGVGGADTSNGKKWIGRKTVKKATEVAKKIGVAGLGDNKIGVPEVAKEFHEVEDENKGVFNIGGVVRSDLDCHSCSISLEQVKDIRELIGVSWVKADAERMMDNDGHKAFAERNDDAVTKQQ